jgi:outer membrane lipoprotein-sorting protein
MRLAGCTILSALLAVPVLAQAPPKAADILRKVANTYSSLTQWDFEATITSTVEPGGRFTRFLRTAGRGSSKRRMEMGSAASRETLVVADGQNVWAYAAQPNQYTKKVQAQEPAGMLSYFDAFPLAYQFGPSGAADARLLREEAIEIGNLKADCYVVQFRENGRTSLRTWWVDKRRFVVLREDQAGGTDPSFAGSNTIWTKTQTDGVSDDLFLFTPPPGAKEQAAP